MAKCWWCGLKLISGVCDYPIDFPERKMHPKCSTNYTKVFEPEIKKARKEGSNETWDNIFKAIGAGKIEIVINNASIKHAGPFSFKENFNNVKNAINSQKFGQEKLKPTKY